jgi:hypothetical protein
MNYAIFFQNTFRKSGFDVHVEHNAFQPPYHPSTAWPLKLPDLEFKDNTVLFLHFQDFITVRDGRIVELDMVSDYYGDRADQVVVMHWPHAMYRYYQGPINLIEFNLHEYNILKNLHDRWPEWQHMFDSPRTHAWQCLNGRMCSHRYQVKEILQNWPNGVLSYHDAIPLPEWAYSTYWGTENEDNFIRLINVYGSCAVNIVTETQYDSAPGIITEKTIMAMLAEQIPIVVGYPGIVADCKELGFDMFDDVVDVSYDYLPNDIRAIKAVELNQDLIQGRVDLSSYQERLRAQRTFLLDDYPTMMEMRFHRDCEQLISNLNLK